MINAEADGAGHSLALGMVDGFPEYVSIPYFGQLGFARDVNSSPKTTKPALGGLLGKRLFQAISFLLGGRLGG